MKTLITSVMRILCALVFALSGFAVSHAAEEGKGEVLFYRNPMNPAITSPVPAKDSMGMDYIPVYAVESGGDATVVRIDPAIVQNLGVRTEPVTRGKLWRRIDTVGTLAYDENRIAHIHVRAEGWVEKLNIHFVGESVRAGDVLFEVYSPVLVNAQAELLQALKV
ncbi:MAG: efflux RND transporter periplasmic adaptor subunit, partial [Gammaproteobacteria bacterium]|nr:efflux RND transporter periplasmic adaptor subunit [Gammaproteobacteria bacterium]